MPGGRGRRVVGERVGGAAICVRDFAEAVERQRFALTVADLADDDEGLRTTFNPGHPGGRRWRIGFRCA
jgi:hypothetical protein